MKKVHLLRREKIKIKKVVLLTLISNGTITLRRKITYRKPKEIINLLVEETLNSLHKFEYLGYFRERINDSENHATKYYSLKLGQVTAAKRIDIAKS
jgi:hypothetical protein